MSKAIERIIIVWTALVVGGGATGLSASDMYLYATGMNSRQLPKDNLVSPMYKNFMAAHIKIVYDSGLTAVLGIFTATAIPGNSEIRGADLPLGSDLPHH